MKGRILFFLWDCERDKGFCSDFSYSTFGKLNSRLGGKMKKKKKAFRLEKAYATWFKDLLWDWVLILLE